MRRESLIEEQLYWPPADCDEVVTLALATYTRRLARRLAAIGERTGPKIFYRLRIIDALRCTEQLYGASLRRILQADVRETLKRRL